MRSTLIEEIAMPLTLTTDQLNNYVGTEVGVSDWILIDQEKINQFAEATGDHQYIHVDPGKGGANTFRNHNRPRLSDDVSDG